MKIKEMLSWVKWFIYFHLPVSRGELVDLSDVVLEMVDSTHEYELLMRSDMRLMFNQMNEQNQKKPVKKSENDSDNDMMFR